MKIDIDKNSNFVIAADIGGTNIRVSLVIKRYYGKEKKVHMIHLLELIKLDC